jgi:hypothetical protein
MVDDDASRRTKASRMKAWHMKAWRAALALTTASTFVSLSGPPVHAQNFARPNLNIQPRVPTIAVTPRINPNVAGAVTGVGRTTPNLKTYQAAATPTATATANA